MLLICICLIFSICLNTKTTYLIVGRNKLVMIILNQQGNIQQQSGSSQTSHQTTTTNTQINIKLLSSFCSTYNLFSTGHERYIINQFYVILDFPNNHYWVFKVRNHNKCIVQPKMKIYSLFSRAVLNHFDFLNSV